MTGRPTKYSEAYDTEAEKLSTLGLPQKDMAYFWGVSEDTITNWKKNHPSFSDAIHKGEANRKIALLKAMYENATKNHNASIQKFLAVNWLGMKSERQDTELSGDVAIKYISHIPQPDKQGEND